VAKRYNVGQDAAYKPKVKIVHYIHGRVRAGTRGELWMVSYVGDKKTELVDPKKLPILIQKAYKSRGPDVKKM